MQCARALECAVDCVHAHVATTAKSPSDQATGLGWGALLRGCSATSALCLLAPQVYVALEKTRRLNLTAFGCELEGSSA